ncbi:hypothetical protein XELAEV_18035145mg [Xenopus laevis]|uniref:Uncharacterized protein n=1 Tax=Xenopus laevis TaxID=8355 RepID=A0A974CHD6_XENLA|nr:hypothetical protein XELAEV_18035145mg [Xenopus laevis]
MYYKIQKNIIEKKLNDKALKNKITSKHLPVAFVEGGGPWCVTRTLAHISQWRTDPLTPPAPPVVPPLTFTHKEDHSNKHTTLFPG